MNNDNVCPDAALVNNDSHVHMEGLVGPTEAVPDLLSVHLTVSSAHQGARLMPVSILCILNVIYDGTRGETVMGGAGHGDGVWAGVCNTTAHLETRAKHEHIEDNASVWVVLCRVL